MTFGILRDRQLEQRDRADEHDHKREHVGKDRPLDEEARKHALPRCGWKRSSADSRAHPSADAVMVTFSGDTVLPGMARSDALGDHPIVGLDAGLDDPEAAVELADGHLALLDHIVLADTSRYSPS